MNLSLLIVALAILVDVEGAVGHGTLSLAHMFPDAWIESIRAWCDFLAYCGTTVMGAAAMPGAFKNRVLNKSVAASLMIGGLLLLGLPSGAQAGDLLPVKAKALPNPFAGGYDITKCGAYYGINSLGTAGAVEGTNVAPGTQVVQGGIGATLGYGCPISASNQSFWFVEGLFDFTNLNGNSNGLALSGPATFVQRFGVGSPLNNMVGLIPGLGSNSSSPAMPSLPTLPNGITAGPGAPYLFAAIHEQDVSAQLGLAQNRQWLISAGIGAGLRYRLSNGVVADTFAEYKLATNSVCTGVLGSAGCAKIGPAAVVGVQFLY